MTTKDNPAVQKMIADLFAQGVTFLPDPERVPVYGLYGELLGARFLDNVLFIKGDKVIKIADHMFYRHSGISVIFDKNKDDSIKLVPVTDQMFYQMIKESVLLRLNKTK